MRGATPGGASHPGAVRRLQWAPLLAVAAGLLTLAAPLRVRMEETPPGGADTAELTLFPTGPWTRLLTFGHGELAADLAWLRAIQYYGEHRKTDGSYPYAGTLFETLTDWDPTFENAYVFGALVLAEDLGNLEAGLRLLQKGIDANPDSWFLTFEHGFLCYVHGRDPGRATPYFERAARMEGSPDWVRRLAAFAARRAGHRETAVRLWLEIYRQTENAEIRRLAADYLLELGVKELEGRELEDRELGEQEFGGRQVEGRKLGAPGSAPDREG